MNETFSKSLQNLVKDELLVASLKAHFTSVLEEIRPRAEQIQAWPDAIIGSQTRAFLTAESAIEVGFKKLNDYSSASGSSVEDNAGL